MLEPQDKGVRSEIERLELLLRGEGVYVQNGKRRRRVRIVDVGGKAFEAKLKVEPVINEADKESSGHQTEALKVGVKV